MRYTAKFRFRQLGTLWRSSRKNVKRYEDNVKYLVDNPSPDYTVMADASEYANDIDGGYVIWHGSEEWLVLWWPINWIYLLMQCGVWLVQSVWWLIRNFPRML